ncbi:MAG TPA: CPBP family intramembrane glutamic endopeptidase [Pirellulales bacterium]|nr:CPBP family intramembrane glutamic endopeptidase [Pirellulales bacterium]
MATTADEIRQPLTRADWLAVAAACVFPTLATWAYFVALAGSPAAKAIYALSKVVQFAFPLAWVVLWQRRSLKLTAPSLAGVGQGLALGAVVVAGMLTLYYGYLKASPVMAGTPAEIAKKMVDFGVGSPLAFLALAAFLSLLHSLLEEYYWRWFAFGQLSRSLPFAAAATVSSLGFMAHHVLVLGGFLKGYGPATWFFSLCVAAGGALWAWIYRRTGTLYGPWASHIVIDAGLMWIGYDLWRAALGSGL